MSALLDAALRISPEYTAPQWEALDRSRPADWKLAARIVHDRLHGRFLRLADKCLDEDRFSGFVVLSIDCLFAETLMQFRKGKTDSKYDVQKYFRHFLSQPQFQPYFKDDETKTRFYEDIRCGLLHQAEARGFWLIKRCEPVMLSTKDADEGKAYTLDVRQFHAAVSQSLEDYCQELQEEKNEDLRTRLWKKMDAICRVRGQRGKIVEE